MTHWGRQALFSITHSTVCYYHLSPLDCTKISLSASYRKVFDAQKQPMTPANKSLTKRSTKTH